MARFVSLVILFSLVCFAFGNIGSLVEVDVRYEDFGEFRNFLSTNNQNIDIWNMETKENHIITIQIHIQNKIKELENLRYIKEIREKMDEKTLYSLAKSSYSNTKWKSSNLTSFFDDFRTYDEIMGFCDMLMEQNPNLITKIEVGKTFQEQTIYAYILTGENSPNGNEKPSIWLQALQHAREWIAPPTLLYSFYSLVEEYNNQNSQVLSVRNIKNLICYQIFNFFSLKS